MVDVELADAALCGAGDFDFLLGDWRVKHRQLGRRLVGDTDWIEFDGEMRARPVLGGLGNFDENIINSPSGRFNACTLRLYHADAQDPLDRRSRNGD